jgi:hypothetical protein
MILKLNGKKHEIKPLSELTAREFIKIIGVSEVNNIQEYISLFTKLSVKELMEAKIRAASLPSLHQMIFDVDVEAVLKNKKKTIYFNNQYLSCESLDLDTFGKLYFYDLYLGKFKAKAITYYHLSLYTLAIALSTNLDDEINKNYEALMDNKWIEVLPQAFFLQKRFNKKRWHLILQSKICMYRLKRTKWKIATSKRRLINLEKRR